MDMRALLRRQFIVAVAMCLLGVPLAMATDATTLTKEQIKQFLLTAKIVGAKESSKGEHKAKVTLASGRTEMNFVDSYKYNIAAYALSEMLGIEDMLPVYVERKYKGDSGSLSWWLPVRMDEAERVAQKITVPDSDAWNNQMYRIRVFDQLVYDDDPNLTNVLIGEDWKIWRVDFSRAFRTKKDLRDPNDLVRCDRYLLEKLRTLDGDQLAEKTKHYLTKDEVKAVMARRDKIVARFQQLVSEKGEAAVLY